MKQQNFNEHTLALLQKVIQSTPRPVAKNVVARCFVASPISLNQLCQHARHTAQITRRYQLTKQKVLWSCHTCYKFAVILWL